MVAPSRCSGSRNGHRRRRLAAHRNASRRLGRGCGGRGSHAATKHARPAGTDGLRGGNLGPMAKPEPAEEREPVEVSAQVVDATIAAFTQLDESGDKRTMNKMARRLGKEQPALLQFAAKYRTDHGDAVGEAAVFYGTLVWAMFDRNVRKCPRLTRANLDDANTVVTEAMAKVDGVGDRAVHERTSPELVDRQRHVYAKLVELIEEDV